MKILEKFVLMLYSLFILIISAIICLTIFKVIKIDQINFCIEYVRNDSALAVTILALSIIFMLLSIIFLFFIKNKKIKKSTATDILLENESGRLLISKSAIENAAKNIVKESLNLDTDMKVTVDIDPANNISIYISIMLDRSLKVRDLTLDLQLRIKSEIKENFGLEVKQVNIKIDSDEKEIMKLEKASEKENQKLEKKSEKEIQKLEKADEGMLDINKIDKNNIIEVKQDENN